MSKDSGDRKVALISGITGQDGSYLTEFLLAKGYYIHGIIRRSSSFNTGRIEHLYQDPHLDRVRLKLHYGDLTDSTSLLSIINAARPTEIYNLAAQSHVKVSFEMPEYTGNVDGLGTLRLLDAVKSGDLVDTCRFYQFFSMEGWAPWHGTLSFFVQASTSELFGLVREVPQKETTPFYPRSPYACAKVFGYWIVVNYREAYNMHASNGILFNHESPRRGPTFVTRKITRHVAKVASNHADGQRPLFLGNLNARRDWGHARDYVRGMWQILQQDQPDDYVIATGKTQSVREFVDLAFKCIGITVQWQGEGLNEVGVCSQTGKTLVKVDPHYFRPTEVDLLLGDPTKAKHKLGWEPEVGIDQLCREMVDHDIALLKKGDLVS